MKEIWKASVVLMILTLVFSAGCKQATELEKTDETTGVLAVTGANGLSIPITLPSAPVITFPAYDGQGVLPFPQNFQWQAVQANPAPTGYQTQVMNTRSNTVIEPATPVLHCDTVDLVGYSYTYNDSFLFRVRAQNSQGYGPWANRYFTVGNIPTAAIPETPDRNAVITTATPLFCWIMQAWTFIPYAANHHLRITDVAANQLVLINTSILPSFGKTIRTPMNTVSPKISCNAAAPAPGASVSIMCTAGVRGAATAISSLINKPLSP